MRVSSRFLVAPLASLGSGLAIAFAAAGWLRSSVADAELLWRVAPVGKLALWILAGAHRVPLSVDAGAGIQSDRLSRLFGRDLPQLGVSTSVLIVPMSILLAIGAIHVLLSRGAARTPTEAVIGALSSGVVHAAGLALLLSAGSSELGFRGRIVQAGVEIAPRLGWALGLGLAWGTAFALAGNLRAFALPGEWRAIGSAWRRGLTWGTLAAAAGLAIAALVRMGTGGLSISTGTGTLTALGVLMLGANALAAALVLSHGASMSLGFEAGPFARWSRIDYLHFGPSGEPAAAGWWLFLLVPVIAGIAAGRRAAPRGPVVAGFGIAWGLTMAVLAALLRIRMLSDFGIGTLAQGGGEGGASVNVPVAFVLGTVWGIAGAGLGSLFAPRAPAEPMVTVAEPPPLQPAAPVVAASPAPAPPPPPGSWTCPQCGAVNPQGGRFCGQCGSRGWG